MFAHVVPNRRLPAQVTGFTYEIPPEINVKVGQFVMIPLRNQKIVGIVTALQREKPPYPVKMIDEAMPSSLPNFHIPLFTWMSETYGTSLASVLQTCLPGAVWPSIKKPRKKKGNLTTTRKAESQEVNPKKLLPLSPKVKSILSDFVKNLLKTTATTLVLEKSIFPRGAFYKALKESISPENQILFLVPETAYANAFGVGEVFHFDLKESEKTDLCTKVSQNKIQAVCGTRASLFLPFHKLEAIVFDYEHNSNYIEKRSPKYHALAVARKMAELLKIPLIIVSAAPQVETFYGITQGIYEKAEWNVPELSIPVQIIDMGLERHKGNRGIFGEEVIMKIARTLSQGNQVLLFSHRTGQAGALLCKDCGNIFTCETCKNTLAVHAGQVLKCHMCNKNYPLPESCPMCDNVQLKELGFGTQAIAKEITKIFGKADVLRLDSETKAASNADSMQTCDIIVATSIIEKPLNLDRLTLSVAVMPDSLLQFPHFRAAERVLQILTHIKNLTNPAGEMVIQTFLPEHRLFKTIEENTLEDFYAYELKSRKALGLVPFTTEA